MNTIAFNPSAADAPPRVLVVADDPLTRAGLGALLGAQPDIQTVGQTVSRDVAGQIAVFDPAVILWDMGGDPTVAFERLAALDDLADIPPPVVALLSDESQAVGAWLAGARGVFLRTARLSHITAGLIAVAHGVVSLDPALISRLITPREVLNIADSLLTDIPGSPLTAREREVLKWLAKGLANKAIAQQLAITESTVKFHVNAILGKLGAQSRTDAVVAGYPIGVGERLTLIGRILFSQYFAFDRLTDSSYANSREWNSLDNAADRQ